MHVVFYIVTRNVELAVYEVNSIQSANTVVATPLSLPCAQSLRSNDVECVSGSATGVNEATGLITVRVWTVATAAASTDGPATPI